ncbi:PR domain zinc finger protein 13 [Crotalus adamanteus]|uniref:PR domain zinc finger protein 13 n=1 Tax=Crotalus adamanteus TaxID=8729 RepID=A0AAW1CA97_CROAD
MIKRCRESPRSGVNVAATQSRLVRNRSSRQKCGQVRMVRGELVDEAGASAVEWIGLIRAARHAQEQTLEAVADLPGGQIFYRALRDVQPGEELTVWYSNALAEWFDIPATATPTHDEKGRLLRASISAGADGSGPARVSCD